jgi:hypothetical protein
MLHRRDVHHVDAGELFEDLENEPRLCAFCLVHGNTRGCIHAGTAAMGSTGSLRLLGGSEPEARKYKDRARIAPRRM